MSTKGLGGRVARTARWLSFAAIPLAIVVALGAASASGAPAQTGWLPNASGHLQKVIVLLRSGPTGTSSALTRIGALHSRETALAHTLRSRGATPSVEGKALPFVVASVSSAQKQALKANPAVRAVYPDSIIPAPKAAVPAGPDSLPSGGGSAANSAAATNPALCGTAAKPETDPEALSVIKATQANALGYTGKGIKVAYIAGPIDTTIPDFQRNSKWASSGSPAGSPVVTAVDFSGDPAGTPNADAAGESFLDAGSIAAQGNQVFDLSKFVNASHSLPKPCDITVTGAAPGASVLGLNVFSASHNTTESNFIQAIDYAVAHGVQVLNESFSANNFPDTAQDVTRIADNEAIARGVTVVVSSGDGGITNTIGSPGTGAQEILSGATTTFRAYEQDFYGGTNASKPFGGNGTWIDNNISSITSAGFAQNGKTIDLVAPGDLNWTPCTTNAALGCVDENGKPVNLMLSGGTSESTPLTSAAAADVMQAYRSSHSSYPSPALVKQILMSTATDIQAPANQQGAGLLNILAAVKEARAVNGGKGSGSMLASPNQIDIQQSKGQTATRTITLTNSSTTSKTVNLSTRTLTSLASHQVGSFCLDPDPKLANVCGEPTPNTFQIWSGVTEVYQEQTFSVPATKAGSRLNFSATYPYTGQASLLHVALFDPSGAYAGYSLPQGVGNYANIQVANPHAGTWLAVFFTEQNGATTGGTGTSGTINWQADTWTAGPAGSISPSTLTIAPGKSKTATFTAKSPSQAGDTSQSIVLKTGGTVNTIPVTVRTMIKVAGNGPGDFSGVVTGGNGRSNPAQSNTYTVHVPTGKRDIDVSTELADPNLSVVAYLVDPRGNVAATSSNQTLNAQGSNIIGTGAVNMYADKPMAGNWTIILDWLQPVSGAELSEPFIGSVGFNQVSAKSNLPKSGTQLTKGKAYTYDVTVKNTAASPELYFLDPRTNNDQLYQLPDQNSANKGSDQNMTLPLKPGLNFPYYLVPTDTSAVETGLSGSAPVTYDIEPFSGDPDLSPAVPTSGAQESQSGNVASLTWGPGAGSYVQNGPWYLDPSEIGPYPSTGAPSVTASASFSVATKAFDPTVETATGDLWTTLEGFANPKTQPFDPVYLEPGESVTIPLIITPSATPGTKVTGAIKVGDTFMVNFATGFLLGSGDELASLPFSYTVK